MSGFERLKPLPWIRILLFYTLILLGTAIARQFPNALQNVLHTITGQHFPWNYNHGFVLLFLALIFYKLFPPQRRIRLLGDRSLAILIFPCIPLFCYGLYGLKNNLDINPHLWAVLFVAATFIYDLMEAYMWRGYLVDALGTMPWVYKAIISGIAWAFWHTLIFDDFGQFGGFGMFILLSILVSFALVYAGVRTNSIVASAAMHATLIRVNYVSLICFILYFILLWRWKKKEDGDATHSPRLVAK